METVQTVQQFYDHLRVYANDATIPQALFLDWLREALLDFVLHARVLQGYAVIPTVAGVQEYLLPYDFLHLYRIEVDGRVVTPVTRNDIPGVSP